jgi:DUF1365 family protein
MLQSALYEGVVTHRRSEPAYQFTQRIALPLLFTHELRAASGLHPMVHLDPAAPAHRYHAVRLERSDFIAPHDVPIEQAVAGQVEAGGGTVHGPVAVLGHIRTWGWLFNPITFYFCFDSAGRDVEWTVLEVTNTPWHERHCYVIGPPGHHVVAKAMHVSPFLPMSALYDIRYSAPGSRLSAHFEVRSAAGLDPSSTPGDSGPLLTASMHLRRRPLDRHGLERLLWRTPAMTARVSAGIYARAGALAVHGAKFHPHPRRSERSSPRRERKTECHP